MLPNTLFVKTPKGQQELETRAANLTATLRSVLILIDGKRTVQQLEKQLHRLGNVNQLLTSLLQQGLIQAQAPDHPVSTRPMATPAHSPATSSKDLTAVKARLGDEIKQYFGLMAGPLLNRLEGHKTPEAVSDYITELHSLMRESLGPRKAEAFLESAKKILQD